MKPSLGRPVPAALAIVLLWMVCRLAVLHETGIPEPVYHDEFSYLLGADTFAHGHLANRQHPLSKFFESPHILVRPRYAAKYPPGQAIFLAFGQRVFGEPFYGVLAGNCLMLFTFSLMLFAWVPFRWALAVSVLFGLYLAPQMYWTNSYSGGSAAASGGALVLLGVGLGRKKQTPLAGCIFALGALLLFWTRPYEGGIFTAAVLLVFAGELWRTRRVSALAAAGAVFAVGVVWTGYYNQSITGNPLLLPYQLHDRQYNVTPVFWPLPLRPEPIYSHPRLAVQHGTGGWEESIYKDDVKNQGFPKGGFIGHLITNAHRAFESIRAPLGTIAILALLIPVAWRDGLYRKLAVIAGIFLLALAVETFHWEHYAAPVWAAVALMMAVWAEHAWNLRIGNQRAGVALLIVVATAVVAPNFYGWLHGIDRGSGYTQTPIGIARRPALLKRLLAINQRQLVIVRYPSPAWRVLEEWVYNSADIDSQQVIFAHDLGMEQDRALLKYYADRKIWLLTFDPVTAVEQIEPYPSEVPAR
jgi:hypothetical protein